MLPLDLQCLCGRDAYDCSGFVGLEKKVMVGVVLSGGCIWTGI